MKHNGLYIVSILFVAVILLVGTYYILPTGNHLSKSLSPYLRQHANSAVNWYEWSDEALEKARQEHKPIILSVGYSSCAECHVMRRKVFGRSDVAELMNEHFVSIMVDKEERPDLDEIYIHATYMLNGSGDYPYQVFLAPNLQPLTATTVLNADEWKERLTLVSTRWKGLSNEMMDLAQEVTGRIAARFAMESVPLPAGKTLGDADIHTLFKHLETTFDKNNGGFGDGVKYPHESELYFLLAYYDQFKNEDALNMAMKTLDHIASGGMYDHIAGGFHSHVKDAEWLVPSFDKPLYTQALLVRAYAELLTRADHPHYKHIINDTMAFVSDLLTSTSAAYYTALDAEAQSLAGMPYVWTKEDIKEALSAEEYELFRQLYYLAKLPESKHKKHPVGGVLNLRHSLPDAAASMGMMYDALLERVKDIHKALGKARAKRKQPYLDHKIITSWNGLMIDGLARAAMVLGNDDYVKQAQKAADFVLQHTRDLQGNMQRIYTRGKAYQNAYLDDYAYMAQGLVTLFRATKEQRYLDEAKKLISEIDKRFADAQLGGYFYTDGSEPIIVRLKSADDAALPSPVSVLAHTMLDLYNITGDMAWRYKVQDIINVFAGSVKMQLVRHSHLLHAQMRLQALPEPKVEESKSENDAPADVAAMRESSDVVGFTAAVDKVEGKIVVLKLALKAQENGWHVNANPASLPSLIATRIDVQTKQLSRTKVRYPKGDSINTPLGKLSIYTDGTELKAEVSFDQEPEAGSEFTILTRLQACKDDLCLAPSDITQTLKLETAN